MKYEATRPVYLVWLLDLNTTNIWLQDELIPSFRGRSTTAEYSQLLSGIPPNVHMQTVIFCHASQSEIAERQENRSAEGTVILQEQ